MPKIGFIPPPPMLLVLALLAAGPGCQKHVVVTSQAANQPTPPPPALEMPLNDLAPGGTAARWPADPARLPDDVRRAARALDWGVMSYTVEPARPRWSPDKWRGVVRMRALTPNGLEVLVVARAEGEASQTGKQVATAARAGPFGDEAMERTYLTKLRETLAGPAMPVRGWGFELPAVEETSEGP